jgi:multidrug efflux pump subunit AcrA (membrane-fusion protein)
LKVLGISYGVKPFAFGLLALAIAGCSHTKAPPAPQVVAMSTAGVGTIQPSQRLAGIIAPYENVAIQSTLIEPADSVTVQEGDSVHVGEVLAVLDTADLVAQLQADLATANSNQATTSHDVYQGSLTIAQGNDSVKSAEAALEQANGNLSRDQAQLSRDQNLYSKGYVSLAQVQQDQATVRGDESAIENTASLLAAAKSTVVANGSLNSGGLEQSTIEQSEAQEQVAQAQAQQIRVQIGKATILSPVEGVVVNRNLNAGEYPGNRQLFTIQQVNPVFAILHGSAAEIAQIQTGATARITAADLGAGANYTGKVVGVLNQINPGSTDFQVKVLLENPFRKLRPGMSVVGVVPLPTVRGVIVPTTAFIDDNHNSLLTVNSDSVVKTAQVVEAASDGKNSIVTGLTAGTRVVNDGQLSVGDGEKVAPQ